ncbi:MAG: ATP-binding cassette domain-containing protein, partial [Candidatus Caldarchaeum sp.]|nr:ATP-binding cassette domain-containing protein [Candidatus Caldarchaeum sp.]MDW8435058.1 ATP-binding cassette domain-containing protein [Candidatus Caldarchaeum sp.]
MSSPPATVLDVKDVSKRFGGIEALKGVSFQVGRGEIFGIIGPNGAGKTVLLNVISAIYSPDQGQIFINSKKTNGLKPHELVKLGVARTFQITRYFPDMNVQENVLTHIHAVRDDLSNSEKIRIIHESLEKVGLSEVKDLKAKA